MAEEPPVHIPAPPSRPQSSCGEQAAAAAAQPQPQQQQQGQIPAPPRIPSLPMPRSDASDVADGTTPRANSARYGKRIYPIDQTMQRPSTPQYSSISMRGGGGKRIFPVAKEVDADAYLEGKSKGEKRRMKDQLALSYKFGTFGNPVGGDGEYGDDEELPTLAFLQKGQSGWTPSGGKAAPIPDVLALETRKKEALRKKKAKAIEDEEPPKPADPEKTTYRLGEEDLNRRKKNRELLISKALKKTEIANKPQINRKEDEPEPVPDGGEKVTKRLVEDIDRRKQGRERTLEKLIKKQDEMNSGCKPGGKPSKIDNLDAFVDRMYGQQQQRKEQQRAALNRKYVKKAEPKKLSAEEQKANSARLYSAAKDRQAAAWSKAQNKYVEQRATKYAKLSEEQRLETAERLYQKRLPGPK